MTSDLDIYRTAKIVIDEYGDRAGWHCAERMIELWNDGNIAGSETWKRIIAAVQQLQRETVSGGETLH